MNSALEIRDARAAVEQIFGELGLRAFVYTVEPKEGGWELRAECAVEEGWQTIVLPVSPADLTASLSDPRARRKLCSVWAPHFEACVKRTASPGRGSAP